jgi:hypothetical protein
MNNSSDAIWNLVSLVSFFVENLLERMLKAVARFSGYTSMFQDDAMNGNSGALEVKGGKSMLLYDL